MRNISLFAVSLVLLTSQVNIPALGDATASALSPEKAKEYEVKLNTNTAEAIEIVGAPKPDFDAEVLAPLKAAQAEAAKKFRKVRKVVVTKTLNVQVTGSHADWMRAAGIAESDFGYVDAIISRESGWGVTKWNYSGSGAYGLGQALPASKMAPYGADYMTNPVTQLRWANAYAVGRYGSWAAAYNHWTVRHSW
jgi:hypothetical protein